MRGLIAPHPPSATLAASPPPLAAPPSPPLAGLLPPPPHHPRRSKRALSRRSVGPPAVAAVVHGSSGPRPLDDSEAGGAGVVPPPSGPAVAAVEAGSVGRCPEVGPHRCQSAQSPRLRRSRICGPDPPAAARSAAPIARGRPAGATSFRAPSGSSPSRASRPVFRRPRQLEAESQFAPQMLRGIRSALLCGRTALEQNYIRQGIYRDRSCVQRDMRQGMFRC